jgi:hypothetical protein
VKEGSRGTEVRGERDSTAVNRMPSIQSRVSSFLAIGLMCLLGLGMLTWYYANAMTRQSRAQQSALAEPRPDRSAGASAAAA